MEFYVVYIREAHPSDGWVTPGNQRQGINIEDPKTLEKRAEVSKTACSLLKIKIPCLVDGMDDKVNKAYAGWPDRLYIVDLEGKIAVMGGQGPGGFKPSVASAQTWLEANAASGKKSR